MEHPVNFFPAFFQALFAIQFLKFGSNLLGLYVFILQLRKPQPQASNIGLFVRPFMGY